MFGIEFTPEALEDLRPLRAYDQRRIIESVEEQLRRQPTRETRNQKRLRPNELAEWEL
jgi:mRNA-degrading endonuclease RelE of RelBE toxin-antitoxin system